MEASTVREEKEQGTGILLQDVKIRVFQLRQRAEFDGLVADPQAASAGPARAPA